MTFTSLSGCRSSYCSIAACSIDVFSNVRMISKSIDVASQDPAQHRVKYVLQTDVRYVSGDKGTFVLDMSLGPKWVAKVFSLKLDAVVKELVLTGSVRLLGP